MIGTTRFYTTRSFLVIGSCWWTVLLAALGGLGAEALRRANASDAGRKEADAPQR
jgi:hypothetical protein